jgi:CxxC motif-containing protein (DUF1111 family)
VFQAVFTPTTGLGPLFNADGCATCHGAPAVGGVGVQIESHATGLVAGECEEHDDINGGAVLQSNATPRLIAAGLTQERVATELPNIAVGRRTTPDLFGFGLLEAVSDAEILRRADPDDRNRDGVSGRPHITEEGAIGRFGRKAQVPDLLDFITDAFIYEQGITSEDEPEEQSNFGLDLPPDVDEAPDPEISEDDIARTVGFVQLLAPPRPRDLDHRGRQGREMFSRIGCTTCHVPALRTGASHPLRALRNRVVQAYTDLLLHDMGEELADICNGEAEPSEFRTEPLMGVRFSLSFLHDGRARSIDEAILMHGGEGRRARERYGRLSSRDRANLLRFVGSL